MKEVLKFTYRFTKQLLTWLFLLLPLQLVSMVVLLVALPLKRHFTVLKMGKDRREQLKLPSYLSWFDNADIHVGRDYSVYNNIYLSDFWTHYHWLTIRNPLNYFGYAVLGVQIEKYWQQVWYTGKDSLKVGDGTGQKEGLWYTEVTIPVDGKDLTYFEYYYIKKYIAFGKQKCFRFRIGHKFGEAKPGDFAQWCFVISPFHSYDGI